MSFYWNEQTWKEIEQNPPEVVLLPVGSVEAHGPHLPLATDSIISDELARRSAAALKLAGVRALILPPVHYVITDFSNDFPGTISVSKESFLKLLQDVANSLSQQDIGTLCILNSHLEPDHIQAIHEFCKTCKKMTILFPDKTRKPWASLLTSEFKQGACHAGSYETSLVLASREDLVRNDRKNLKPNPVNLAILMKQGTKTFKQAGANEAYFGDPASATVEEGEHTYQILTRMVVETILQQKNRS